MPAVSADDLWLSHETNLRRRVEGELYIYIYIYMYIYISIYNNVKMRIHNVKYTLHIHIKSTVLRFEIICRI